MNLLFLTLQYDFEKEKEYMKKSKVAMQGAANTFQHNLLAGFEETHCDVTIMNTLPMATYPKYNQLIMKTSRGKLQGYDNVEIGYINFPLAKQYTRYKNYKKQIKRWIHETKGEKCIMAYSLYLPFEKIFKYIKKKYPDVKVGIVCPDLPCEFGILPKNKLKATIQNYYGRKLLKYAKHCDFFVLLTEAMKNPLVVGSRKYTIVEGICNGEIPKIPIKSNKKSVLYAGTLNRQFGILTLIEAFSLIDDPEAELWVCGGGDVENKVIAAAEKDNRIKFYGYVTKEEVVKLQKEAFLLINPRQNEGEYTKYSFPSKTMEYMLSGKPVLMYKLDGIPAEYDQFLNYIEGNSAEDMKNAICKIFNEDENKIANKALSAARYVAENKNSFKQAEKIIDLISELE